MTYASLEVTGGEPVELYVFVVEGVTERYTSSDTPITLVAVNDPNSNPLDGTYAPGVILREATEASTEPSSGDVEFAMALTSPFVDHFRYDRIPQTPVLCTIYRYQRQDADTEIITIFDGEIASFAAKEATMQFHCTPTQAVLKRTIPVFVVKSDCNNVLFDGLCAYGRPTMRADFAVPGVVGALSLTGSVFTIAAAATKPDGYFTRGELVSADGRRGHIIAHAGDQVTIMLPFPEGTVVVGDAVTLYPGCDGRYATCRDTFANVPNFFGFDNMPADDPFKHPQQ